MHLAKNSITFRVVSGPGYVQVSIIAKLFLAALNNLTALNRLQGTHNGDAGSHEPNNSPSHMAYHGLVPDSPPRWQLFLSLFRSSLLFM